MSHKLQASAPPSGGWLLLQKPKAVAYRGPSGKTDPALLRKAELRQGYVALCVVGEVENGDCTGKLRVFTATNPADVFKTAQMHNWREIEVHGVLWTPGKIEADKLRAMVDRELKPFHIRGSWYELDPQMIINTIVTCALELRADLFNDQKRYENYERLIADEMKKRAMLQKAKTAPMPRPSARIYPFERTRR